MPPLCWTKFLPCHFGFSKKSWKSLGKIPAELKVTELLLLQNLNMFYGDQLNVATFKFIKRRIAKLFNHSWKLFPANYHLSLSHYCCSTVAKLLCPLSENWLPLHRMHSFYYSIFPSFCSHFDSAWEKRLQALTGSSKVAVTERPRQAARYKIWYNPKFIREIGNNHPFPSFWQILSKEVNYNSALQVPHNNSLHKQVMS